MNNEIIEPKNNPITTKLIDLIKEKIWLIIGGLLSSSMIAYVVSRFFIRSYLNEIGYNGQLYNTLADSANTAVLTFGIFTTFVALFIQFYIVPSLLRFFYFENIEYYENVHNENKKKITGFFMVCFLSPLSVLLLYHFKLSISWFFPIAFSSILLFLWIIYKKNSLEFKEKLAILYSGSNFSTCVLISLFPFSTVLQSIDYKGLSGAVTLIIFIVIWFVYSILQGWLVIQREKVHYIIGVLVSLLIVFEISILSPNLIKTAIAESIGIKDKDAKIYQIPQSNYDELSPRIQIFWQFETSCNIGDENCSMLVANYDVSCTKDCDNPVYLNSQVIFRDNKNAIICPPNYKFGKDMNDRCLLIDQDILIPTSQTVEGLINNKKITTINYVMNEVK